MVIRIPNMLSKHDGAPIGAVHSGELRVLLGELRALTAMVERELHRRAAWWKRATVKEVEASFGR